MEGNLDEEVLIVKREFLNVKLKILLKILIQLNFNKYQKHHEFENYKHSLKEFQIRKLEVEKSILNYYLEQTKEDYEEKIRKYEENLNKKKFEKGTQSSIDLDKEEEDEIKPKKKKIK